MIVAVDAHLKSRRPDIPRAGRAVDHAYPPALDLAHDLHWVTRIVGGIAVHDRQRRDRAQLIEHFFVLPITRVPNLIDAIEMAPDLLHQGRHPVVPLGVADDSEPRGHGGDIIRNHVATITIMSERDFPGGRVRVSRGDITTLAVDAVVNAANQQLAGGGGVDGAIHRAGGPEIMAEIRRLFPEGCPTGSAVTTGGGRMPARLVIHAVGPRWRGGGHGEDRQLASAWRSALQEAVDHGAESVAFPSLATGIYGFPVERAAGLAMAAVREGLARLPEGRSLDVTVCAFSASDEVVYSRALDELA